MEVPMTERERDIFIELADQLAEMTEIVKLKREEARARGASAAALAAYDDPILHARITVKVSRAMLEVRGVTTGEGIEEAMRRGIAGRVDSARAIHRDAAGNGGAGELAGTAGPRAGAEDVGGLH
jgi:hypothetical protein